MRFVLEMEAAETSNMYVCAYVHLLWSPDSCPGSLQLCHVFCLALPLAVLVC